MGLFARFKNANKNRDNGTEMVCYYRVVPKAAELFPRVTGVPKAEYCPRAQRPEGNILPEDPVTQGQYAA